MVCRVRKGVAPIPASGLHRKDATAHPDLEMESEATAVVPDDAYGVSSPFIGNAFSTRALATGKSIGTGKAPHPTMQFCGGDSLLTYARAHGVRSRSAWAHPVHGASDGPRDF